jgi:hypothetical protein
MGNPAWKGQGMKNSGAAVLMLALASLLVGGCSDGLGSSAGATTNIMPNEMTVENAFNLLDKMKAEDLVTAPQHEQLRRALVEKIDHIVKRELSQIDVYRYISEKYDKLTNLRRLQKGGKISQAEYEKIRETVLGLS